MRFVFDGLRIPIWKEVIHMRTENLSTISVEVAPAPRLMSGGGGGGGGGGGSCGGGRAATAAEAAAVAAEAARVPTLIA
jgi:hypothetical protein